MHHGRLASSLISSGITETTITYCPLRHFATVHSTRRAGLLLLEVVQILAVLLFVILVRCSAVIDHAPVTCS
jgi:hypothetical protein